MTGVVMRWINRFGKGSIGFLTEMGGLFLLLFNAVLWVFRPPFRLRNIIKQMESVGVGSIPEAVPVRSC